MRVFKTMEIDEAVTHASEGGQALHLHRIIVNPRLAPACFVNAVRRGENIAHLFDQDETRLVATARGLGVNVIRIERRGTPHQHIDLCAGPLRKALAMTEGGP